MLAININFSRSCAVTVKVAIGFTLRVQSLTPAFRSHYAPGLEGQAGSQWASEL